MSNCQSGANSQLKALQARMDRIDDDLMAHYAGISQMVIGLAANPLTAGSVAKLLPIYNLTSAGQTLIKQLTGMLPGVETFKSLQHMEAAGLIENMGSRIATQAATAAAHAAEQSVQAATAQAAATVALAQAVKDGITGASLAPFQEAVATTTAALNQAQGAISVIESFLSTCGDIANCRTRSQVIEP